MKKKSVKEETKMSVEEFLEKFNGAPYDDVELASIASDVEGDLGSKALAFLKAWKKFRAALDQIEYESPDEH